MKATVLAVMRSHLDQHTDLPIENESMQNGLLEDLKRFSGAEAGICYMSKPYFDSYVSDELKALTRFGTVSKTGHHSISGHAQVGLLLEGIPKIIAMYLNNLTDYETSEKSGSYTVMTGSTEEEMRVYEKWCVKLQELIEKKYGDKIDERTRDKLAKENARYMLSVFTPTTMGYTTSLRQWNYIIDWCRRFVENDNTPKNYFFDTLKKYFGELADILTPILYVEELRDIKNRVGLDMVDWNGDNITEFKFGKVYNIGYWASFAEYAQAQRHRTLFYTMQFKGVPERYYVPEIVSEFGFDDEWNIDMDSVSQYVPTGTLIYTEESGKIINFYLKSMERNCGRAQLEIMKQNLETSKLFYEHRDEFPERERKFILDYYKSNNEPKMKGQLLACREQCVWGCEGARTRII